jgi:hypothetical protein
MSIEDNSGLKSGFNEAIPQVQRIANSWTEINRKITKYNYRDWETELMVAWNELYPKVVQKWGEDCKVIKYINEVNKQIAKAKLTQDKKKRRNEYGVYLSIKTRKLKLVSDLVGTGGHMKSEEEEGFE